jgi:hypothetical protein
MHPSNEKAFRKFRSIFYKILTLAFFKIKEGIRYSIKRMPIILSIINEENLSNDSRLS